MSTFLIGLALLAIAMLVVWGIVRHSARAFVEGQKRKRHHEPFARLPDRGSHGRPRKK